MKAYLVVYHYEADYEFDKPFTSNEKLFTTEKKAKDYIEEQMRGKEVEELELGDLSCEYCEHNHKCNGCCPKIKIFNVQRRDDDEEPDAFEWYEIESLDLED